MVKINVDELADTIMQGLEEYRDLATDELKKISGKVARNVRKDIMENAPVGKTGAYRKSWSVRKDKETSQSVLYIVHSKNRYQLAHLLEKGHALWQGGRTKAQPHILPAEEKGVRDFESEIRRALSDG